MCLIIHFHFGQYSDMSCHSLSSTPVLSHPTSLHSLLRRETISSRLLSFFLPFRFWSLLLFRLDFSFCHRPYIGLSLTDDIRMCSMPFSDKTFTSVIPTSHLNLQDLIHTHTQKLHEHLSRQCRRNTCRCAGFVPYFTILYKSIRQCAMLVLLCDGVAKNFEAEKSEIMTEVDIRENGKGAKKILKAKVCSNVKENVEESMRRKRLAYYIYARHEITNYTGQKLSPQRVCGNYFGS